MTPLRVRDVPPGGRFRYRGQRYVRATPEQRAGHPAAVRMRTGCVVLAYTDDRTHTPCAFLAGVWVRGEDVEQ